MRRRRINFARLNYVLIPETREQAQRLERSLAVRLVLRPLFGWLGGYSREGGTLIVLATLSAGLALDVTGTYGYVLWSVLSGILLAAFAVRLAFPLRDVALRLEHPPRIAAGEPLTVNLLVTNTGARPIEALRTRYAMLTWDGRWLGERPCAARILPGQTVRLARRCRFDARGEKHAGPIGACVLAPGGLSTGKVRYTSDLKVTVLPRVARVERIASDAGARYQPGGLALASRTGESMELIGVRPYRRGDPVRDLHARTWARLGAPHVREYQQEYFTRVGVVLDTERGATTEVGEEAAISLAAGVLAWYSRSETLIDLLVIGDVVHPVTIGRSLGTLEHGLEILALVRPGAPFDPAALSARLAPHLERLSAIVFIALRWDPGRAGFARAIAAQGVACRPVLVGDDVRAPDVPVPYLDAMHINQGRPVVLP